MTAAAADAPRRRVPSRQTALLLAGGVALASAGIGIATSGGGGTPAPAHTVATGLATAETRSLVDHEDVDGRLAYASRATVAAGARGTLTRAAPEGDVVRRGGSLFAVDGRRTAYVMYGSTPAWRDLSASATDGADVRQLERNLVALGYDPYDDVDVDGDFDWATTAAVRRWEDARGVTEDGVVPRGEVVFTDGPVRVGTHEVAAGGAVAPGAPVLSISSRRRVVTARLAAGRQGLVRTGQRVTVTLPDGSTVRGTVTEVGRVAQAGQDGGEATVALEVALRSTRDLRLDGAPVSVSVARTAARRALAVPVAALVATAAGRYAVEVPAGSGRRLVPVELGAFADGWVEVRGGLVDGTRVVVPR